MHVLYVYMFYIVLFKDMHVIASVIHFCNYIYNFTVDPSLTP